MRTPLWIKFAFAAALAGGTVAQALARAGLVSAE